MNRSTSPVSQQLSSNAHQQSNQISNINTNTSVTRRRRPSAVPSMRTARSAEPPLKFYDSPIQAEQQHYQYQQRLTFFQPLTTDTLAKKDAIDFLLNNNPFSTVERRVKRRRSICNGYIGRKLYNEDNTPILFAEPSKERKRYNNSHASINSTITEASTNNVLYSCQHHDSLSRRRHSSYAILPGMENKETTSSINGLPREERHHH
ncbi:hypothetical protein BDF20DRAFT_230118 [Mycotypha africana]|uniref:uncharacterized protein n=1 Tax=Mycotypha africana TaxID=64632 RepID=UPI002300DEB2|nr:uncharacterized protein BDF20DRAFT_230118 [Mycotypha africana]KAI8967338.1 hypothetical protein BDF20DRAFT_230118 [Mycotypha africana]